MVGRDVGSGYDRGLGVVRHFVKTVQELGRYVARVGLNASKGSVGETTMSREKSREAKLG